MGALFSRPREPDYDTYLNKLQTQIAARQARLQQIRLRERRANALFITYGLGLWILYSVLWWFEVFASSSYTHSWESKALRTAPVVLSPVAIICTRRVSRFYFRTRQEKEEKSLKSLVKQKQDKVEEIKKKTGYYSTRDLLEKYDEALRKGPTGSAPSTPAKQASGATRNVLPGGVATPATPGRPGVSGTPSTPQNQLRTPGGPNAATPMNPMTPAGPSAGPVAGATPATAGMVPFPGMGMVPPPTPHTRSIMDKVADALLGVSPEESNPFNKYALICAKCFSHNGLCPKDDFDFVQYRCPRCGHFNPRRRDPPSAGGPSAPGNSMPSLDVASRHRRVHSEFAPSPLGGGASFARDFHTSAADDEPEEEGEFAEMVEPRAGAGAAGASAKETETTALEAKSDARRRRARKAAASDAEEEDAMDTD
ncbi:hypothetical protein BMF94_2073 [Rhodotorula taiwanensis]|uniref:Endoplasmic reticulum junction formation protein lunapark n=1 Tax=Rhodotorula taiwanensis TaxID=741276 RepID=A0A2S5BDF6_9BASI|nr:hypothetical protein BMF94_2073 [Rhodotorula taiwanensis]